jgi:hypothetical protein
MKKTFTFERKNTNFRAETVILPRKNVIIFEKQMGGPDLCADGLAWQYAEESVVGLGADQVGARLGRQNGIGEASDRMHAGADLLQGGA